MNKIEMLMIHEIILNVLSGVKNEQLKPEMRLVEDLGADSLEILRILVMISEEFEITISMNQIGNSPTIQELYDIIGICNSKQSQS